MIHKILFTLFLALSSVTSSFAAMVHINQADATTFAENLVGIGMVKAKAIIKYRNDNGDFVTINGLTKVKGIGVKTVEKNRENLTVDTAKDEKPVTKR